MRFDKNLDVEGLSEKLDEMRREAHEMMEGFDNLAADLNECSLSITSDNGMVTVSIDGGGDITELRLARGATRLRGNLGPLIVRTIQEAQAAFATKMTETMDASIPGVDMGKLTGQFTTPEMRERVRGHLEQP
ncbi:YbaB/EbfC family nucleoid-associated protein [Haloglycomyces albus]|uniref:YbaB/EbfC family nucleoid-associated protein n=1 Tax=Haloglycomyces albus TaxID=526067 RepID=UPI00046D5886|nr:YbaB/EbfC family nucleoid-associated protein [Haloglycomyces albus]